MVVDSQLVISPNALILKDDKTLVVYVNDAQNKAASFADNVGLLQVADQSGKVCLKSLLQALAARGINDLLVEAGQGLNGALLTQHLIDELIVYQAPIIMGNQALGMFAIPALTNMQQRTELALLEVLQIGQDVRLRFKPTSY